MTQRIESWGRYPKATPARVTRLFDRNAPLPQSDLPMLVFGNGRSYGDVYRAAALRRQPPGLHAHRELGLVRRQRRRRSSRAARIRWLRDGAPQGFVVCGLRTAPNGTVIAQIFGCLGSERASRRCGRSRFSSQLVDYFDGAEGGTRTRMPVGEGF